MRTFRSTFIALFLFPLLVQSSTIYLRDGQVLEGLENLREFDNVFLYERNTRNISIPKDRIQKVIDDNGVTVFELLLRTMKQREDTTNTVAFDFSINGQNLGFGEWYQEGKFRVTRGRISDGTYQEYYPSGRVKREYTFKNGNLNGPCKEFYASGIVERESIMENGLENGLSKNFHQSGQIAGEAFFRNGEKDGVAKLYYESGAIQSIMNFSNGKMVGKQQVLYESGQVEVEVEFDNGIKEGPIRQYYETGNIKMVGEFKNGTLEGEVINYYESGRVKERKILRKGRIIEG